MKNFQRAYEIVYDKIELLMNELRVMSTSGLKVTLYHEETVDMMINRWGKLEKVGVVPQSSIAVPVLCMCSPPVHHSMPSPPTSDSTFSLYTLFTVFFVFFLC